MDKKYPPIEINIDDDFKFAQVAYLVDREDFTRDVINIRINKLKLNEKLPYDEVKKWEDNENLLILTASRGKKGSISPTTKEAILPILEQYPSYRLSEQFAEQLRRKYRKSLNFLNVIKYSILCGKITNNEYDSLQCYCAILPGYLPSTDPEVKKLEYHGNYYPTIAIILSPDTKKEDLNNVYQNQFLQIKKIYNKRILDLSREPFITRGAIRNKRKWYWLNYRKRKKGRLGYQTIASRIEKGEVSWTTVREAIKDYKKKLTLKI